MPFARVGWGGVRGAVGFGFGWVLAVLVVGLRPWVWVFGLFGFVSSGPFAAVAWYCLWVLHGFAFGVVWC